MKKKLNKLLAQREHQSKICTVIILKIEYNNLFKLYFVSFKTSLIGSRFQALVLLSIILFKKKN